MIQRETDPKLINSIVNKPEVRATFGIHMRDTISPIDFSEMFNRNDYIILSNGIDACALFDGEGPAIWDGHTIFDVTARRGKGRDTIETGKAFLQWMWDNTKAQIIYGKTPVENRPARLFNKWIGFQSSGVAPFHSPHGIWDAEWFHILRPQVWVNINTNS